MTTRALMRLPKMKSEHFINDLRELISRIRETRREQIVHFRALQCPNDEQSAKFHGLWAALTDTLQELEAMAGEWQHDRPAFLATELMMKGNDDEG
jgi:hypothetical protein